VIHVYLVVMPYYGEEPHTAIFFKNGINSKFENRRL
jgi:putative methionine-R-sulfoxide reductase with GAF domain